MSNMNNLPEWTAQALVAAGAVFLLISAYWMGVYVPGQKELSDDFESHYTYEGDMTIMDQGKFITLQGDFDPANSLNTHPGGHVDYALTADPSKSNDEETFYHTEVTAYTDTTEAVPIVTLSSSDSYVDRTTYESRANGTEIEDFAYTTWNPNSLPKHENTQWPNPFESSWTNNYIFNTTETINGIETYHYIVDEPNIPYSNDNIETLKASFDGFLPEGVEGQSHGYMVYYEEVWVAVETGQVVDRDLIVTMMFAPDPLLAANFYFGETWVSITQYTGTLDGAAVDATQTIQGIEVNEGADNATDAVGDYLTAQGTLDVVDQTTGNSTRMVNSTVVISSTKWTAQIPQGDGTYLDVGSTFFSAGVVCDTATDYNFANPFLNTHLNTYRCEDASASVNGINNGLTMTVGDIPAYHFQSVENDVYFGMLDQDGDGVDDTAFLPVFDPITGYCNNPAACGDRSWSSLVTFALSTSQLGDITALPISSNETMDLPMLGTAEMVGAGTALMGGSYHPIIQAGFVELNDYAASLGLTNDAGGPLTYFDIAIAIDPVASEGFALPQLGDSSTGCTLGSAFNPIVQSQLTVIPGYEALCIDTYGTMSLPDVYTGGSDAFMFGADFHPFVQSQLSDIPGYETIPIKTEGNMTLPMPGTIECVSAGLCIMGSDFTHPLVAGILSEVMVGLGQAPGNYTNLPWVLDENMTLPVPGNLSMFENGTAKLAAQYHPLIQAELAVTESYGVDLATTPWALGPQMYLPTLNGTEYIYGLMVGLDGCPAMCYNVVALDNTSAAAAAGILGNQSVPGDPTTWVYDPACTMGDMNVTSGTCVFGVGVFASFQDAPLSLDSYMPSISVAALPKMVDSDLPIMVAASYPAMELDSALPDFADQTMELYMDYEENVWIDPVTGLTLDQVYNITVSIIFEWGTKIAVQTIDVEYTDAQVMASTGSRWQTEFAMTYFPGSPAHADMVDFPILTLDGGYTTAEVNEGVNTVQDTSSALQTGEVTVPTLLIGLSIISLAAGFYVYYQNGQEAHLDEGTEDFSDETEVSSGMATTVEEESTEDEAADDSSDGEEESED